MCNKMQIKKKYVAISSFSWFNEEWTETDFPPWEPAMLFPHQVYPDNFIWNAEVKVSFWKTIDLTSIGLCEYLHARKMSILEFPLNVELVLMGCQNASACINTETSVILKTDQCKHHLCLKNITSVEVLRCLGLKRFRTYCLLCHNKVGLAAA